MDDQDRMAAKAAVTRVLVDAASKGELEAELYPRRELDIFGGLLRPVIPMPQEQHRLLRAVAIKRAQKIPGEQPSIGAVVQELIERHRAELEREAGTLFKRELSKKR